MDRELWRAMTGPFLKGDSDWKKNNYMLVKQLAEQWLGELDKLYTGHEVLTSHEYVRPDMIDTV